MTFFTPQLRLYFTKCELECLDEDNYESRSEKMIVDKALTILDNHLIEGVYEFDDEEELEILQLALLTWDKYRSG